jgi:hypothetical protein
MSDDEEPRTTKGPGVPLTLEQLLNTDFSAMSNEELTAHVARLQQLRKKDLRQLLKDESQERPEHQGFIYIASNLAMPGLVKIGSTAGAVDKRLAALSQTTSAPAAFEKKQEFPVYRNVKEIEKRIHADLDIFRSARNREFFRLPVELATCMIQVLLERYDCASSPVDKK